MSNKKLSLEDVGKDEAKPLFKENEEKQLVTKTIQAQVTEETKNKFTEIVGRGNESNIARKLVLALIDGKIKPKDLGLLSFRK